MSKKLLMLTALAGSHFSVAKGDVVSHYDAAEADRWIAADFAEEAPKGAKATVIILEPDAAPVTPEVEVIETTAEAVVDETTADATTVETTADNTVVEAR